ncbi:hypothetical protein EOA60_36180 [Mesorhizobium sp. M1A.F.Ca.IN.020.06.1.1]|uniref:hypothetical protein n=1 Tax=unclassified Mesorhizobium TaxID=325217 RepID=UPI000FD4CC5E|nr:MULTISPECIES: hypothetical protein [unclassified Mesorhizobium]RUW05565.1 hypothetical protein EOA46_28185 [Mesorhizobium sp. M1A.F.Ca.IN.022.05.2.1]RUW07074.1 hypothetical protein EOA60_36180 [Mesorhizobium sp. M1A.F.Ca.IN.020.06.1.1]RUU97435.1 hypothetical protein EOA79_24950 [Mesorhizobium sp. M1A.F.Ca.IN.020.03.2.1]RWF82420.1 MAG: hypothetical protein EOQ35_10255 [Mesorhizobium sp.]RWG00557.1 MAG: hypothetical protein EOQ38_14015 [Mesorhizobium sp.]
MAFTSAFIMLDIEHSPENLPCPDGSSTCRFQDALQPQQIAIGRTPDSHGYERGHETGKAGRRAAKEKAATSARGLAISILLVTSIAMAHFHCRR